MYNREHLGDATASTSGLWHSGVCSAWLSAFACVDRTGLAVGGESAARLLRVVLIGGVYLFCCERHARSEWQLLGGRD